MESTYVNFDDEKYPGLETDTEEKALSFETLKIEMILIVMNLNQLHNKQMNLVNVGYI